MDDPILIARDLMADGSQGRIFGPVDVTLYPEQMCVVAGPAGSGKSSLLLALCGRFRAATGSLELCGIDAAANPYDALMHTSIARLGDYVGPEDRLTLRESILDRAYIDGISPDTALKRADLMAEALGVRVDVKAQLEKMDSLDRAVVAVALAMVRPASVIALDDADLRIRHRDLPRLYSALRRLLAIDGAALVMSVADDDFVPEGSVVLHLERTLDTAPVETDPDSPTEEESGPETVSFTDPEPHLHTAAAQGDHRRHAPGRLREVEPEGPAPDADAGPPVSASPPAADEAGAPPETPAHTDTSTRSEQ
ncbi:ATP-binding cassette domain-containing protein [Mobilicoccus sp.]|uniref:ATP-binding cassette domain-containing protein n=1 Tax=Mobilicoccus sp. TaxID=2034349 RepID=UPI0028A5C186|nr:ATP-binding cassette domain-containing protein [Mobilicoccus sp.]